MGGGGGGGPKSGLADAHRGDPVPSDSDQWGLGDPILRVGYDVFRSSTRAHLVSVYAVGKAPVADEETGFSTGEWDAGGGIAWRYSATKVRFLAEATYWRLGQPPEVILVNPVIYRLGIGHYFSQGKTLVEVSAFGRTETIADVGGSHLIGLTVERRLGHRKLFFATASVGLSEGAPDGVLVVGMRVGL